MLTSEKKRLIQESLRCLAASHAATVAQIEETMAVLASGRVTIEGSWSDRSDQERLLSATESHLKNTPGPIAQASGIAFTTSSQPGRPGPFRQG